MNLWPSTLQQLLNSSSWDYKFGETNIRSSMDTGAAKVRRRFTHSIDSMSCTIDLHKDQYTTFDTFYRVTLNSGVNTFSFQNPLTGTVNDKWRFVSPPSISYIGGEYFRVSMNWELLP